MTNTSSPQVLPGVVKDAVDRVAIAGYQCVIRAMIDGRVRGECAEQDEIVAAADRLKAAEVRFDRTIADLRVLLGVAR